MTIVQTDLQREVAALMVEALNLDVAIESIDPAAPLYGEGLGLDSIDIREAKRPDDPNWNYSRFQILFSAYELGCRRFGNYANGSIHLDRTEGRRPARRMWRVVR